MKGSRVLVSAILATLLMAVPPGSQAFFGFFGGGFGFGFGGGWSGWGGPGWWGDYPGYWGGPGYWGNRYYSNWRHPYAWHQYRRWYQPAYALGLPYAHGPGVVALAPKAPEAEREK